MKRALFFFAISLYGLLSAQNGKVEGVNTSVHANDSKIEISFFASTLLNNPVVIITDHMGRVVFLENKFKFKGNYDRVVDLSSTGYGTYFLYIINDDERIHKVLFLQ